MSVVALPASYKQRSRRSTLIVGSPLIPARRRHPEHHLGTSAEPTKRAYATSGLALREIRKLARYEVGTLLCHPFGAGWRDQHDSAARR